MKDSPFWSYDAQRRVPWDKGQYSRDLWLWDLNPSLGQLCTTYLGDTPQPSYTEQACVASMLNVLPAWQTTRGAGSVVAVVDSGCDVTHPEFAGRILGGCSPSSAAPWKEDTWGHGTAVAGTVAGIHTGMAPEAQLYIIRGGYDMAIIPAAVDAAIAANACCLVLSWSWGIDYTPAKEALIKAGEHGITVVCSAMNENSNAEAILNYPATWNLPNVIVVSSNTMADWPYSVAGFSTRLVHLHAPGRLVIAPRIRGGYHYTSGTSFAAPKVAGAIALLKSRLPKLSVAGVRQQLFASVDRSAAYADKNYSGGRLNVGYLVNGPSLQIEKTSVWGEFLRLQGPREARFQIETSGDLRQWTEEGPVLVADAEGCWQYGVEASGQARFFRARLVSPAPSGFSTTTLVVTDSRLVYNQGWDCP